MKHTPGPWVHFRDNDGSYIVGPDSFHIARMEDMRAGGDKNARLIAAAPDLLAACQLQVSFCPMCMADWDCEDQACFDSRAAIAAALGANGYD